jgi:hypothetical protein
VISGILIVVAIAVIMAFFVAVAITITSVICGYERDRKREAGSPREFWLLLSLLVVGIFNHTRPLHNFNLVVFCISCWKVFYLDDQRIILYSKNPHSG